MAIAKRALITGITGQDGSYLAEFLLDAGYDVVGAVRRSSTVPFERLAPIQDRLVLDTADLLDEGSLISLLQRHRPHEVYNLAAQSYVRASFSQPVYTGDVTGLGVTRLLDAIRIVDPDIRIYQASSAEMFGDAATAPQDESTPFRPRSPYAAAKAYAHWVTVNYRDTYELFACCGIAFNHESPRRGHEFFTRKVSRGVAAIKAGTATELHLGDLDPQRDWGFAGDYVRGMWLMLQHDEPDDYVLATGTTHSLRDFVAIAFAHAGLDWREHVRYDETLRAPAEVHALIGDPTKAQQTLGWVAATNVEQLAAMMVDADLETA